MLDGINAEKKKYQMKEECMKIHSLFSLEKEMPLARTLIFETILYRKEKRSNRISVHAKALARPLFARMTYKLLLFNDIIMLAKIPKEDELVLEKKI